MKFVIDTTRKLEYSIGLKSSQNDKNDAYVLVKQRHRNGAKIMEAT